MDVTLDKLLLAGIIPAILITLLLMAQVTITARIKKLPRDDVRPSLSAILQKFVVSAPALFAPILLIGSLMSDYFGPTDVVGVTVA
ncbi:MAG: TRAP transporter large permease subunit [Pseudorhizobium sp.]